MANINGAASEGGSLNLRQYDFWDRTVKSPVMGRRRPPPGAGFLTRFVADRPPG